MRSDVPGCRAGIDAADRARWVAAAEGGFAVLLARDGLTSCTLFFLDLPGPDERVEDVFDFSWGLTGDDSRDGKGEFAADVTRLERDFFVGPDVDTDAVIESRGVDIVEIGPADEGAVSSAVS